MNRTDNNNLLLEKIENRLQRIANVLLLNASFIDNPGLLNGKMGIAIFFYHYSRYTNNKIYEDYAGELIDEIYEQINTSTPVNFENGLTGIGWGIEYLVKNKFVQADTDEALADIDNTVYKHRLNNPILINSGDDLFGYGLFHIIRLLEHEIDDKNLNTLIKKQHLIFLTDECERLLIHKRYLDFNIISLSVGTISSLFWFLLEMYKLKLFPVKTRKLLKYLHEYLVFRIKENEIPADSFVLHNLAQRAFESISDIEIKELFQPLANSNRPDLSAIRDDGSFVDNLTSLNLKKLIYQPYLETYDLSPGSFDRAFRFIDNEGKWNSWLDELDKSNLGLNGFAGLGLYILNEAMRPDFKKHLLTSDRMEE
jgi:hypothetical protein